MKLAPFGEGVVYIDLAIEGAVDRGARTLAVATALREAFPEADVAAGAGAVIVSGIAMTDEARDVAAQALARGAGAYPATLIHEIRAIYDGPDLEPTAAALGLTTDEIIAMHTGREVVAELAGFLPGFAYLGPIDPRLIVPRRPSPRPSVPARSIGIAGTFTAIYPFTCPGGWTLIGRAVDVVPFDPTRDPPMLIAPGDRVRFVRVAEGEASREDSGDRGEHNASGSGTKAERALEITAAPACATVQDRGRPGQLSRGIPPSGPLDQFTLTAANRAVGNEPGAAAVEVLMGGLRARARGRLFISIDGNPPRWIEEGEELSLANDETRAVRYLAVRGGADVPLVLGARSTLLAARLGGFHGRSLRKGDILPIASDASSSELATGDIDTSRESGRSLEMGSAELEIDPGPHLDRFPEGALAALVAGPWQVSRLGNRVGMRLEGSRIPRDRPDLALPVPMVRGAIQVSTDGTPIVLGPDHPVTGGYPVLAVMRRGSQAALARLRPGADVKLRQGQ